MSYLKAWDVVRTCVLSWRCRHLWASVPCLDLRVGQDDYEEVPENFLKFVRLLFRHRDVSASLDTSACGRAMFFEVTQSSNVDGAHDEDHARSWVPDGIKRGARAIHVVGHRRVHGSSLAVLEHTAFVSSLLKVLKLSYALPHDNMLRQLSSQCPALEEQHLMDCVMTGHEISSASLKILTMFKCKINVNLSVASPNLILLRCVSPITQALSFGDMGLLVTGTIILDDRSFYEDDFEDFSKDELEETTDEDDNDSYWKDKNRYGFGVPLDGYCFKCNHDYGSDIESDDNTYEYSEIANDSAEYGFDGDDHSSSKDAKHHVYGENSGSNDNKVLGGHNVLHSLSNATSLELLVDAGETFNRKALESSVKPKGRSFSCKRLQMVKIKCSKDDVRVHKVAHLFRANGVPVEKIFVRRTGSTCRNSSSGGDDEFWGDDKFWGHNEFSGDDEFSEDDEFWGYG
ncbi:hypothetical protein EJB05_58054, partial [Eragrostis curvula]